MTSGKQRRAELDAKRQARADRAALNRVLAARAALEQEAARGAPVNRAALAPHNSYFDPDFVTRGFYADQPFICMDCGKAEVWRARQQKWWYEVAKGDVFTIARRCRACRRRERERREAARRVHQEGLDRKRETQDRSGGLA